MQKTMSLHQEVILAVVGVIAPTAADVSVNQAIKLDHQTATAMHLVTIVCTIAVAAYTIWRKGKRK